MKILILIIIGSMILVGAGCTSDQKQNASSTAGEEYYTCPMHPSVRSDRPGACPVCGMALVKKSAMKEADKTDLANLSNISLSPTQRVLANVSVLPVRKSRLLKEIVTSGVVESQEPNQSTITARFRGRIETLFVSSVGQQVSKGERLFALYSPDISSAQQDYLLALRGSQLATSDQYSGGAANVLNSAQERLRRHYGMTDQQLKEIETSGQASPTITFYAPFAGTVLQKPVVQGQYVDEGTVLYQLADLSQVWIYLDVYEQDFHIVREGLEAELTSDAFPGRTFSGRVTFIDPVLNPETRSVRLRVVSRNQDHLLKPGMFLRGRISVLLDPSLVVPSNAVLSTGQRDVVWVEVHNNTFEPREIKKGVTGGDLTQVLAGLREGESVVATGGFLIDSENSLQSPGNDPHSGHIQPARSPDETGSDIFLRVKGSYTPDVLKARKDIPLRLKVYRDEKSACTEEIVFPDFGVRSALASFDTTLIVFTPDRAGRFSFSCGMDMVHGTLIVE